MNHYHIKGISKLFVSRHDSTFCINCTINLQLFVCCKTLLTWIFAIAIYQFLMPYLGLFPEILEYIHRGCLRSFSVCITWEPQHVQIWPFKLLSNDPCLNWRQRNKEKLLTGTLNYLQCFVVFVSFIKVFDYLLSQREWEWVLKRYWVLVLTDYKKQV